MNHPLQSRHLVPLLLLTLGLGGLPACLIGPLDVLGNDTKVTEHETKEKEQKIEDDRIEDKHPQYNPELTVVEAFDGCLVTLNKSGSVTKLDVLPPEEQDPSLQGKLFSTRAEALAALAQVPGADVLPSMEVVNGFMKPFNDGLYAAVEVALQQGMNPLLQSKQQFLQSLLSRLGEQAAAATSEAKTAFENAAVFVGAGLLLGGASLDLPAALKSRAEQLAANFQDRAAIFAKPIGFYTWNDTLAGIFSQDRYLQLNDIYLSGFGEADIPGIFFAIAAVLAEDAALTAQYEQILALYTGLTNPYVAYTPLDLIGAATFPDALQDPAAQWAKFSTNHPPLRACLPTNLALFPSSTSKDTEYFMKTFCVGSPPADFNFMDFLIQSIREGKLDLTPDENAGWYGYQLYALETLLLPERGAESDHLLLTAAYKKKLIETFKSILTQNRETHVKQLNMGGSTSPGPERTVDIYPKFEVEPFPTFYLRSARAYRFLATYLSGVLGQDLLAAVSRIYEDNHRSELPLDQELKQMTELLYGLYVLASQSVGLDPVAGLLDEEQAEFSLEACLARARAWVGGWHQDRDILADPRVIVPFWRDPAENVYWAILGIKVIKISAEFVKGYEPVVLDATGQDGYIGYSVGKILPHEYYLLMEQMQEVRIPNGTPPPTREQFRQICDEHQNLEAIISALEGLGR